MNLAAFTPLDLRKLATERARARESFMLEDVLPVLSAGPVTLMVSILPALFNLSARSFRLFLPSAVRSLVDALPDLNSVSPDSVSLAGAPGWKKGGTAGAA